MSQKDLFECFDELALEMEAQDSSSSKGAPPPSSTHTSQDGGPGSAADLRPTAKKACSKVDSADIRCYGNLMRPPQAESAELRDEETSLLSFEDVDTFDDFEDFG